MNRWTKEKLKETVLIVKNKRDFCKNYPAAYNAARKYGKPFCEELFSSLPICPNPFKKNIHLVYAYFFDDGCAYIGSTMDESARISNHMRRGPVFTKIKTGVTYVYVKLEQCISYADILKREQYYIELYKKFQYDLLNKVGAFSRGTLASKWTKQRIIQEAKKYKTFSEWRKKSKTSYNAAHKMQILNMFSNYYTNNTSVSQQDLINDAMKYNTKIEWRKKSRKLYDMAHARNIISACCTHMHKLRTDWSFDAIVTDAARYTCVRDWKSTSPTIYNAAAKKKILHLCRATFISGRRFRTDDEIVSDAANYNSVSIWRKHDNSGYRIAQNRNILHRCKLSINK